MNLIAAVDKNHGIGYKGQLLYDIPDDLRYFKEKTKGKVVVMGYATLMSLPNSKPLPDRVNIVLSDAPVKIDGAIICGSLKELFEKLKEYDGDDVFIIGGEIVYNLLIDYCEYCYITEIDKAAPADKFLKIDKSAWKKIEEGDEREHNGIKYRFCVLKNERPLSI
jgi:dihydrofolate reductase